MLAASALWLKRLAAAAIVVAALAYIPYRLQGSDGYVRYRALKDEHERLAQGNLALRQENRQLRREMLRLKNDLSAVAGVARNELGMVGEGEILIQIDRSQGSERGR
ncbi:MAG: septum formation initiator family protein [Deltaproteobacteria bacterium]|nr:septum formation initiator family protein [Deltaproteobacteria bacterium]